MRARGPAGAPSRPAGLPGGAPPLRWPGTSATARRGPALGLLWVALLLAPCAFCGCRSASPQAADAEVYRHLARRRGAVPEAAGPLELAQAETAAQRSRALALAPGAHASLTLAETLRLATLASREVRRQREDVYLSALALTDARHDLRAIPFASLGGSVEEADGDGTAAAEGTVGLSRALTRGGQVTVALATDLLKNLAGSPLSTAQSILSLDALLPLARGSGVRVARENLTQAERDVLYALRSYGRFQQRFTLDTASAYYRVLAARDTWQNEERTYESLLRFEERQQALGAQGAGRMPGFQVEQARQDTLRADDRRQRAQAAYASALDDWKLGLGLPASAPGEPSDAELAALTAAGPAAVPYGQEGALRVARAHRLDLQNARDQVEDARRKAEVARDGLGPQVDLRLGADLSTPSTRPLDLKDASRRLSLGLELDLPLDRTPERNAYRTALIQAVRALRALEELEDEVERQVRSDLRALEQARRSHAIQGESVRLAERRVESTLLLLEAGQAQTRDVLDAQDDLLGAKNALVLALVDHAIARLTLELDLGTLRMDGASSAPASAPSGAPAALPPSTVPGPLGGPAAGSAPPAPPAPPPPAVGGGPATSK